MKKVVIGIIVVVVLLLAGAVYLGWRAIAGGNITPADFATKPWVEYRYHTGRLAVDVPPELKPPDQEPVDDTLTHAGRWRGMEVVASATQDFTFVGQDSATALDWMAEKLRQRPGITTLSETRKQETVLGAKAISLLIDIKTTLGLKGRNRVLLFIFENRGYQLHYSTYASDRLGDAVWERMVKSIRRVTPASPQGTGVPEPETGLPPGFKRR